MTIKTRSLVLMFCSGHVNNIVCFEHAILTIRCEALRLKVTDWVTAGEEGLETRRTCVRSSVMFPTS